MTKIAVDVSSIILTAPTDIGIGIDRTGKPVDANGGIAVGVAAQKGVVGDTIRIDHGPICEALSGAAIDPATNPLVMWNNVGKLIPYAAGTGIRAAGTVQQQGGTATAANQWVRFYPAIHT